MTTPVARRARKKQTSEGIGAGDGVGRYLDGIGKYDLLTAEEEVDLAKLVEAGQLAAAELEEGAEGLTAKERVALERKVRKGAEAKNTFVSANLRLVVSNARKYTVNEAKLELSDLIQEGNLGLTRAVEKFEWRKGFKFSTYATWWIRQSITRAIADKARTIRIPVSLYGTAATVHAVQSNLIIKLGRDPKVHEIVAESGVPEKEVRLALSIPDASSLEIPIGEDGASLGDFIEDESAEDPLQRAVTSGMRDELLEHVKRLPERERRLLFMRYGFGDGRPLTFAEIGEEMNLTRERIRQLEKLALCRLRHPSFGVAERDVR